MTAFDRLASAWRRTVTGPAPREPGIYDLHPDGRWLPAGDVRVPDLSRPLPAGGRGSR